jgi:hypothetical protein
MEGSFEKMGGPNTAVEIEESKFGWRKYHRGHPVKEQRVFGGVERQSGETFLVPVPDRTADTLMAVLGARIEPGTTVTSDCWGVTAISTRKVTHTAPSTTAQSSLTNVRDSTPTQSTALGVMPSLI